MTENQESDIKQLVDCGNDLALKNFHREAAECFKMAIAMEPTRDEDLIIQGQAMASLEDYWNAALLFDLSINRDPSDPRSHNHKGVSLEESGCSTEKKLGWNSAKQHYEDALISFDNALKINAEYADAWNNKGICLYRLHRYQEALECFDRVIGIDPTSGDPWYNKSLTHEMMGLKSEAAAEMAKAKKLGLDKP